MRRLALLTGVAILALTPSPVLVGQSGPPPLTPFRGLIDHASRTFTGGVPAGSVDGTVHAVSGDGRYVTFSTGSTDIVPDDIYWAYDIYVRDRVTGITSRVAIPEGGGESDGNSWMPAISTNGRHVVFSSAATNLVAGDTNGIADVFVRDLDANRTVRVSVTTGGTQADADGYWPSISADGRFVAYLSSATTYEPGTPQYGPAQVYLHDRDVDADGVFDEAGATATSRVTIGVGGGPADQQSTRPRVSADGRYVMFESDATNLDPPGYSNNQHHVYIYDRVIGQTTLVDRAVTGGPSQWGVSWGSADMSDDGRFVTYTSMSPDIVYSAGNGQPQVFRYDSLAAPGPQTTVVTLRTDGFVSNGWSYATTVSADGRYVGFLSSATDLAEPAPVGGRYAIYVADTLDGSFTRVDVIDGVGFDGQYLFTPSLSADGTAIAFLSDASNAVNGAFTNYNPHMFVATAFSASVPPTAPQEGGAGSIEVNTTATSGWDASVPSFDDWITLTDGADYAAGPRTLHYVVSANPSGIVRTGRIRVGSLWVTIRQAGDGDTTPPVITPIVTGTQTPAGWFNTDAAVSWTVSDPDSEIVNTSWACTSTVTVTTDTLGTPVTCEATSHGGTNTVTFVVRRDTVAPMISITQPAAAFYPTTEPRMPSYYCSEPFGYSDVATCEGTLPQDGWLDMSPGRHTFSVTATDLAGNSATKTVEYVVAASSPACVALPSVPGRLKHWWRFDGNLRDGISNSDSSLSVGTPTFQAAIAQQGWSVSGSGNFMYGPPAPATLAGSGLTVAAWVRPNGHYGSYATIISNPLQYDIGRYPDGTLRWAFRTTAGFDWVNTGVELPLQYWSHVAVSYADGQVRTYVNGRLVHEAALNGTLTASGDPLLATRIGGRSGVNATLIGTLDDLMIFDTPLSAQELDSLALAGGGSLCRLFSSTLTLTAPPTIVYGTTFQLSARLADASGRGLPNRAVTLTSTISPSGVRNLTTDANGSVTAQYAITTSTTAGDYPDALTAVFSNDGTFAHAAAGAGVTVLGATPPLTWNAPPAIPYGTALGSAQLNATSTLPGTFAYAPAAGTVLDAGSHTLSVTFTPSDTAHYAPRTMTQTIVVNQAAPAVEISGAPLVYNAQPRQAIVTVRGAGGAELNPFTVLYDGAAALPVNAGTYAVQVSYAGSANYAPATATGSLVIDKATPVMASIDDITVTYDGQPHGISVNVAGFEGWLTPVVVTYGGSAAAPVDAGVYTIEARYDGSANYNAVSRTATLTILKAAPSLTWPVPGSITYGTALGAAQLNATANVPGTFAYAPEAGTVPGAGTHTLTATFTPADAVNYSTATATRSLSVAKANALVTWYPPAPIAYGTPLGAAQLNATASTSGTFTYSQPAGTVLTAGTHVVTVTFTPDDLANYNSPATAGVPIVVTKAVPAITWSFTGGITYGTPLDGAQLNATASVPGTFAYSPAAGTVLGAGTHTLTATFTPADADNYESVSTNRSMFVAKVNALVMWDAPAPVVYGTPLGAAQLNATASTSGTFVYAPAAGTVLGAGTHVVSVTFTPEDTANYEGATRSVSITVTKAVPVVTWAAMTELVYGTPLGSEQLNATANVPGTFAYSPGAGTVLNAGSHGITATFTPDDTANYDGAAVTAPLLVRPAEPAITWPAPAEIVYGTALGAAQLNATANVAGTFTYSPAAGTVLETGTHTLSVTFVSSDSNHGGGTKTVTLNVTKAIPSITWPAPAEVVYGTALGAAQLNATAGVEGTFAYSPANGTLLNAGSHTLSVTFTPTDTDNYATATASVTLSVARAPAPITWWEPADLEYGMPLGASQLNAATNVPGTFAYSPAAGTVLPAGLHQLSATFTPADPANYTGSSATRSIHVYPRPLKIWPNNASKVFGAPLPPLSATPDGFVNGDSMASLTGALIVSTPATPSSPVGSYVITASGVSSPNYAIIFQTGTLTVSPASTATSVVTSPNPAGLNQPVTFTATVAAVAPGAGVPQGTVSFFDGGVSLGAATLSGGTASLTTNGFTAGSHGVSAFYNGDANFATSFVNGTFTVKTSAASSTTTVGSSTNPSFVGQTITLTATVTGPGGLNGSVAFYDGATLIGTATLSGSTARLFNVSLAAGGHAITARYLGNATVPPSVSPALAQYVRQGGGTRTSTVALSASPSPAVMGVPFTLTATVTGSQNDDPTGVVLFLLNGSVIGQGTLSRTGNVTAVATLQTAQPHGVHRVEAVYLGDTRFRASKALISLIVN